VNDSIVFRFKNTTAAPLRFSIHSINDSLQQDLVKNSLSTILIQPRDSVKRKFKNTYSLLDSELDEVLDVAIKFGDLNQKIIESPLKLPFSIGSKYKLLQGYDSEFTHNKPISKYALDFRMDEGEKICAVHDGTVVAVLDKYSLGAADSKLLSYANHITIYHEKLGTYSKYVHIKQFGSLVKNGDKVKQGDVIGFSGNVGFSTEPHLHFCYFKPDKNDSVEGGLIAIPAMFKGGLAGEYFKRGMWIENVN